jgi:GxxExxY protein
MTDLLHADLTYMLRGVAFSVHNELRGGHEEAVYEAALAYAFEDAGVSFQEQPVYRIDYRGQQVGEYRPDFAVGGGKVLIDLKVAPQIEPLHKAQMISYLAVTHAELGLIMNFGAAAMLIERIPNFLAQRQVEANPPPMPESDKLLYAELCHRTLDALAQVHRTLGIGFLHQVYRRAARIELAACDIEYTYLKELPISYKGHVIKMTPTRLLLVENKLLLATVAMQAIPTAAIERLRWAMNVTGVRLGLIVNFHGTRLDLQFIRER